MPEQATSDMAAKTSRPIANKIRPTTDSVVDFINGLEDARKRDDSLVLLDVLRAVSGEEPVLWSNGYIGFGMKRHKSPLTGRESDWMRIGFSPRKANFSLYFGTTVDMHAAALETLGKHKAAMGCLYVKKLADVNLKVLRGMFEAGWEEL